MASTCGACVVAGPPDSPGFVGGHAVELAAALSLTADSTGADSCNDRRKRCSRKQVGCLQNTAFFSLVVDSQSHFQNGSVFEVLHETGGVKMDDMIFQPVVALPLVFPSTQFARSSKSGSLRLECFEICIPFFP